ncbi:MAG: hypothetical protein U0670_02285 [Anaerolineae bacterium]
MREVDPHLPIQIIEVGFHVQEIGRHPLKRDHARAAMHMPVRDRGADQRGGEEDDQGGESE